MVAVLICEKFGWTYQEYSEQPIQFIQLIIEKMRIDTQKEENAVKAAKRKQR